MDLEAASVDDLELGKWEGADTAIAVEFECIFQMGASGVGGTAFVVGDGDFFPRIDMTDCVDGLTLCIAVPTIMSIWKTAVINEANGRIDATNHGVGTAGQIKMTSAINSIGSAKMSCSKVSTFTLKAKISAKSLLRDEPSRVVRYAY